MDSTKTHSEVPVRGGITLRWLIIIAAALVLLLALFYGEEDFMGARAWRNFKQARAAEGEKFDLTDYVPASVADEQNFAMTPLLRPSLDYLWTTNGIRWHDTNAVQHLQNIRIDVGRSDARTPKVTDLEQGGLVNLKAFADFYRGNTNYPQSAHPENDAEVILAALNKFEPDFKELSEAAAARPYSRFPIEYDHKPPAGILLPHLASIKGLTSVLVLRANAELEVQRSADALADLRLALRLSASVQDEPFLIDHLVRIASLSLTLQGVRQGLTAHRWSDSQLAELETNLASIDLLGEYEHTMRGERSLNIGGVDYLRRQGPKGSGFDAPDEFPPGSGAFFSWLPDGWYYRNMALIGEVYRDYILPAIDTSNRVVNPAMGDKMLRDVAGRRIGPYNVFAKLMLPALANAAQRTARGQTLLDETRVACSVERYRMQQGHLPDTLDALAPQFIPKIPNDLFDGKPLRYIKNADGTYVLYSIGWNQRDDGGVAGKKNGSTPHPDPNQGDWVWESQPGTK